MTDLLVSDRSLRITEIFCSIQGESSWAGCRTVFVRLTGCPLRCVYCDSAYAFNGGEKINQEDILQKVASYNPEYVCVTGGEPLAQEGCLVFLGRLCDEGYKVSLETSGALSIKKVDDRVKRIVDFKTPSSQEVNKNDYSNIEYLNHLDEVKFVVGTREDYEWAKNLFSKYDLASKVSHVLFSPVVSIGENKSGINPQDLADWLVEDNLQVRMQLQMHKYIWGDVPGH